MRGAVGQPLAEDPPDAPPVPARKEQPDGDKTYYWRSPDGKSGLNGTRLADLPLYDSEQVES